jgi:hypothetical protein
VGHSLPIVEWDNPLEANLLGFELQAARGCPLKVTFIRCSLVDVPLEQPSRQFGRRI